jgi:N-acetylglucosamine kinase-like BadF-type ATPase
VLRREGIRDVTFDLPGIRTDIPLIPQLADVVAHAATAAGHRIGIVAAGVSGLTLEASLPDLLRSLTEKHGVRDVYLAHDSITSYLGALGDDRGVVVAVGTGVVTLGVGAHSVARIDGWGNLIGDAGSGYWIGRAALDAVMRAYDGRGEATSLTELVLRDFPDLEHAYIELQGDPARVSRIAAYARAVAERAPTDRVARAICDGAAAELVLSAATGLRVVGEDSSAVPVACGIGGVLRSPEIGVPFERGLRALWPSIDLRPAVANGLEGAALLPLLGERSALRERVASSLPRV